MTEPKPEDYAEILRKHYATIKRPDGRPRYRMSERNRRKIERIRRKVAEMRGGL